MTLIASIKAPTGRRPLLAKAGGADTSSLEEGLEKTDGAITTLASEVEKLTSRSTP